MSRFILCPIPGPCLAATSLVAPGVSPDIRSFTNFTMDEENLFVYVSVWLWPLPSSSLDRSSIDGPCYLRRTRNSGLRKLSPRCRALWPRQGLLLMSSRCAPCVKGDTRRPVRGSRLLLLALGVCCYNLLIPRLMATRIFQYIRAIESVTH